MKSFSTVSVVFALVVCVCGAAAVNPILLFPGYSLSKLDVTVSGGSEPSCPSDGTFTVEYTMDATQNGFSTECMFNYLSLSYNASNTVKPFSNRNDVTVTIPGRTTGNTQCFGSALYDDMVSFFVSKGYTTNSPNANFLAACYDWRIDPSNDAIAGPSFLNNTQTLVEQAYAASGNQKVWLIGHSNGPIMALYFLNRVSAQFKQKYIAGFIPLSGNFAGQGLLPVVFVEGLTVVDFMFSELTAPVHRGWPSNYFSSPQPAVFTGPNNLTFIATSTRNYTVTSADFDAFYTDSNNTFGLQNWRKFTGLVGPHTPPGVFTYAIWGQGIPTLFGVKINSFSNITIEDYFFRNGDGNQEDIDNESSKVWNSTMPTGCFDYWTLDNVDHFALNSNITVLNKLFQLVSAPPPTTVCTPATATTSSTSTTATASTSSTSTTATATTSSSSTSTARNSTTTAGATSNAGSVGISVMGVLIAIALLC